jgi:hypothetical protein
MNTIFVVCATVGGTVLLLQFIMALIGLGGHGFDSDVATDVGHDFSCDVHGGGDFHNGDMHDGEVHGDDASYGVQGGDAGLHPIIAHGSSWLFGVLSLRTVVAALAFFGLSGLAADSAGASTLTSLFVAACAGLTAMFAVYGVMRKLTRMRSDGTVRIQRSVGLHGDVYLRIPGSNSGCGKIQFDLQNRTMEYSAVTAGPELPTGAKIVVVGIVNPSTLEVVAEN